MGDKNLYTQSISSVNDSYDSRDIKRRLMPYQQYLERIKKYHDEKSFTLEYRIRDPAGNPDCVIELVDPGEHKRNQIYSTNLDRVYEYYPRNGTGRPPTKDQEIKITDKDSKEMTLHLDRKPATERLLVRYNTYQINAEILALKSLAYRPIPEHLGLLRLVDKDLRWPDMQKEDVDGWFILKKDLDGVQEQRRFVKMALATPDFAFLEGPPGSGKTTVLAELIMQLAAKGKRVLFCASTHVAVDNLLERIIEEHGTMPVDIIPLRIGHPSSVSEMAMPYQYDRYLRTIKKDLESHLSGQKQMSGSQKALQEVLGRHDYTYGKMARDCANLVCGTTIGILQYPDIKDKTGPVRLHDHRRGVQDHVSGVSGICRVRGSLDRGGRHQPTFPIHG